MATPRLPIALAVPLLALACRGTPPTPAGEALYQRYCASCHGTTGRGDGPVASAFTPPPTDLTRHKASIPDLMQVIDGRYTVRAHGTATMPVWGEVFEQIHLDDAHAKRTALLQVEALADYVARLGSGDGKQPAR